MLNTMPNKVLNKIALNLDADILSWNGNPNSNEGLFKFRLACSKLRSATCFEFSECFAYRLTDATFWISHQKPRHSSAYPVFQCSVIRSGVSI